MITDWISTATADQLAIQGYEAWMERDASTCASAIARARTSFASKETNWLIASLHQSNHPRGARGVHSLADQFAYCSLMDMILRHDLYLTTIPVSGWALPDRQCEDNERLLMTASGIEAVVYEPSTYGHDGHIVITEPTRMLGVGMGDDDDRSEIKVLEPRATISLEIGSCTLAKSVAILGLGGALARFPYEIEGGQPSLFLYSTTPLAVLSPDALPSFN